MRISERVVRNCVMDSGFESVEVMARKVRLLRGKVM